MDYPKSLPSAGLVNGRFVDEDPVTGTPGSLIPASWGNSVTQEILEVIKSSGVAADEGDNTQLRSAINALILKKQNESLAAQEDAEAGTNAAKLMTPLRVFQAIARKVQQATEAFVGTAKIASQAEVNAGTADSSIVTPKNSNLDLWCDWVLLVMWFSLHGWAESSSSGLTAVPVRPAITIMAS